MHLILTGATGLVGSGVLDAMLKNSAVSKISILSRRPVPMADQDTRVKVYQQKDLSKIDTGVLNELKGAKGCVWALGVSQTAVGKEEYVKITHDMTMDAASAFANLSPSFNFVFVSGEGATHTPGLFSAIFARVKGQTELDLLDFSKQHQGFNTYALRPAMVDQTYHEAIHPYTPKVSSVRRMFNTSLRPALRLLSSNIISPTDHLGRVLVDLALSDGKPLEGVGIEGEGRIITNQGMRRLAGLSY
ncbi:nucleoside-diphosphate-sugar epimerase [Lineolata rhizophorae]|uniref:Nucleoside-diphosphate-sugar epimerase n=1 Tax=Lineolata rhizophorae TaxID=578093 RepID=A0A6A6PCL8_9PEZI|nr:nucleoside-diphosphate-sugar epimerase [Lineolata rhizophorae]